MTKGVQILAPHPFLPGDWLQDRGKNVVPDINPASTVYSRMRERQIGAGDLSAMRGLDGTNADSGDPGAPGGPGNNGTNGSNGTNGITSVRNQVIILNQLLCQVISALNGASIACDPDSQEVTLTLPDLPANCI